MGRAFPERIEAYLNMARLMKGLKADAIQWPDISSEVLIRDAKASPPDTASPVPLSPSRSGGERRGGASLFLKLSTAAATLAALAIAWHFLLSRKPTKPPSANSACSFN